MTCDQLIQHPRGEVVFSQVVVLNSTFKICLKLLYGVGVNFF